MTIIQSLKSFEKGFWLMALDCLFSWSIGFSSIVLGSGEYVDRFSYMPFESAQIITVPYLISAFMMPVLGKMCDKYGQRMHIIIIGGFLTLGSHVIQMLLSDCQKCWWSFIPIIINGIVLSIYTAVMWGSVSFIVPESQVGMAFGIVICLQNFGTTIIPVFLGYIHDTTVRLHGYFWVETVLSIFSLISLFLKLRLLKWDKKYRFGLLNSSNPHE